LTTSGAFCFITLTTGVSRVLVTPAQAPARKTANKRMKQNRIVFMKINSFLIKLEQPVADLTVRSKLSLPIGESKQKRSLHFSSQRRMRLPIAGRPDHNLRLFLLKMLQILVMGHTAFGISFFKVIMKVSIEKPGCSSRLLQESY